MMQSENGVLGYGPWQVGGLLLRESMITTVLGTLLGMPLGYLLMLATAEEYASDMFRMPIVAAPELWLLNTPSLVLTDRVWGRSRCTATPVISGSRVVARPAFTGPQFVLGQRVRYTPASDVAA